MYLSSQQSNQLKSGFKLLLLYKKTNLLRVASLIRTDNNDGHAFL